MEKPRRRFSFSLRTIFVLVTAAGCALGWLGVQVKWIRDRHAALRGLEQGMRSLPRDASRAPWSIRLLGEPGVRTIHLRPDGSADLQARARDLKRIFPEASIYADYTVWEERDVIIEDVLLLE